MNVNTTRKFTLQIVTAALPEGVRAMISGSDADGYIIMIDSNLSPADQEAAFLHECLHLYRQDTTSAADADAAEREAWRV